MTRTQYYTATSIDGFIADQDNSLDWLFQVGAGDAAAEGTAQDRFSRFFAGIGAMAMGSTTYEWILAHEKLRADPSRWRASYGDVPCWVFTHRRLPVIDGAPQIADLAVSAIKAANLVLIPVQPSPYDIWAASDLVELVKQRIEVTDGRLRAAFVISRLIKGTRLAR